jgi:hypothetical protein
MRIVKLTHTAAYFLFFGAFTMPLFGQVQDWPSILGLPPQAAPSVDSNGILVGTEQSLYMRRLRSLDTATIMKNTPAYGVNQNVDYELTNDYWSGTRSQFLDMSGEAVKKNLPFGMTAGLEWVPVCIYNRYPSSLGVLGSVEAGPVMHFQPFGIPVMVHAGGAARAWNDSLTQSLTASRYDELSRDKGLYAGVELGSSTLPLAHLPMYLNFKGYDRSMDSSTLVAATGSVLLYHAMPNGDSLFGLYSDSLVNGNTVLGQNGNVPRFINDPMKTERAFGLSAGFKGATRLFLDPAAVISYNQHSLSYHDQQNLIPDRTNTDCALLLVLSTVPAFPISYKGVLKIDWGDDQNSAILKAGQEVSNSLLAVDLDSYKSYRVALDQCVSKFYPNGMGVEYAFDISRFSRDYPNFYIQNNDTVRSNNDNDIIVNKQKVTVVPVPVSWGNATLFYEFSKNLSNYIKKEKSGQNTIDWFYEVGATYKNTVFGRCTLSEATSADAKVTRYAFPEMNRGNPPPYSRKWTSLTIANVSLSRRLVLSTELDETYSDNGTLDSREYLDTTELQDQEFMAGYKDYYAIAEKLWEHDIKLSLDVKVLEPLLVGAGCGYEVNDAKTFDILSNTYVTAGYAGTRISPFVRIKSDFSKRFGGRALIMYNFDSKENFWDILISLNGEF